MSAGLTAAAGLEQGVGRYEAGQERSALFNANAGIAAKQAQSEAQAGAYNEEIVRMKGAALTGQQIAQTGGNNLQQTGTPAAVVAGSRMVNEMDALQTRNNALRRAWGFEVQGASDQTQAGFAEKAGVNAGLDSILTGGARSYDQFNKTGSWF